MLFRSYWEQQLAGGSGLLPLQIDRPRQIPPTGVGGWRSFKPDRSLVQDLESLSQQQGVTVANMLLATFKTLLYRDTGTEDLIVGIPTINQVDGETFVNAIAVRTNLAGDSTFIDLLQQVQQIVTSAQPNQTIPIELIEGLQLHVTFVFETDRKSVV